MIYYAVKERWISSIKHDFPDPFINHPGFSMLHIFFGGLLLAQFSVSMALPTRLTERWARKAGQGCELSGEQLMSSFRDDHFAMT